MKPIDMHWGKNKEYKGGKVLEEYLVLEVEEDSPVVVVRSPTKKKGLAALHNKGCLEMKIEEA